MAVSWDGEFVTAPAAADLSAQRYKIGYVTPAGQIALATGPNQGNMGVIVEAGRGAGKQATLRVRGIQKASMAAGTYNPGDKVQPDANGRLAAHTAPTANTTTGAITSSDVFGVVNTQGGTAVVADTLLQVDIVKTKI